MIDSSNTLIEVEENNYPLISVEVGKLISVDYVNQLLYIIYFFPFDSSNFYILTG